VFQTLRIPFSEEIGSLTARPGYLRLYGRESFNSLFHQALVARRWSDFRFEATTAVEFSPTSFLQLAGMTNYYNTQNWSAIYITHDETNSRDFLRGAFRDTSALALLSEQNTIHRSAFSQMNHGQLFVAGMMRRKAESSLY